MPAESTRGFPPTILRICDICGTFRVLD